MNDREFETILKSPQTNAFDPSSLSGSSLEHNQTIFGDPLSHEPLGMPSFEDTFEAIWQERSQGAEGSELEEDASAEDASTSGFLAPTNFSVDQVVAHFPSLDSALESGSVLWDRGTSAFEQVVESGSLLAKDKLEALSDTVQSKLEVAWDDWNASDNSLHNALDQKIEEAVEDVNEWANDVGRSEFWARVKQRYNQTIDSVSGFTEGVAEALGYGTSASDISKEEAAVESAMSRLADNLMDLTQDPDFETTIKTAFGEADITKAEELIEGIAEGKGGPEIEVIDGEKLEGLGAFGDGRIFISDETVAESVGNPEILDRVLLEEVGHYLDQELNDIDSPGDEGEIFAGLAQKETFSVQELQDLKNEDDNSALITDDKTIVVENFGVPDWLEDPESAIKDAASNAWDKTKDVADDAWDKTKDVADDAWDKTKDVAADAWDKTKEVTADAWDKTKEVTADAWDKTKEVTADAWDKTKEVTADAWDKTKEVAEEITDGPNSSSEGEVPAYASADESDVHLSYDSSDSMLTGERVEQWQQQLEDLGYEIDVDGYHGSETDAVTRKFQEDHGLEVDGIVGPKTLAALNEASVKADSSTSSDSTVSSESPSAEDSKDSDTGSLFGWAGDTLSAVGDSVGDQLDHFGDGLDFGDGLSAVGPGPFGPGQFGNVSGDLSYFGNAIGTAASDWYNEDLPEWLNENESNVNRVIGGLQVFDGVQEITTGVALLPTGAVTVGTSSALGVGVIAHGADTTFAGAKAIWTGEEQETYTQQGLSAAIDAIPGVDEETADQTAGIVEGVASSVASGGVSESRVAREAADNLAAKGVDDVAGLGDDVAGLGDDVTEELGDDVAEEITEETGEEISEGVAKGADDTEPSPLQQGQVPDISPQREKHILDGDETGGGHGHGRGIPGKSEFPEGWSDDDILASIEDVTSNPSSKWEQLTGKPGATHTRKGEPVRWSAEGTRNGLKIRVIVEPDGEGVISAYPPDIKPNP